MKLICSHNDGTLETLELAGPLEIIQHPAGKMEILHDAGTGDDYWFDKATGYFDGTGCSVKAQSLTSEEARLLLQGLKEMREGKTKPFSQIKDELEGKKRLN